MLTAREGVPEPEDSCISHLSAESTALGVYGRNGTALNPSTHARIRSAPPARARVGGDTLSKHDMTATWIPSIPGRFASGPTHGIPVLSVRSGANSVSSSRVPSSTANLSRRNASARRHFPWHFPDMHEGSMDVSNLKTLLHPTEVKTSEANAQLQHRRNILQTPRANWRADSQGWSRVAHGSRRCSTVIPPESLTLAQN